MLRYALVFGAIPGLVVISVMIAGFVLGDGEIPSGSEAVGFLTMFIAFSLIFVGVKRYRDKERGGVVTFWAAFGLGAAMAAVAGVFYVAAWEAYLAATDYAFMSNYAEASLAQKRAAGASEEALASHAARMAEMAEAYANPLFRLPITFSEIFPVGLVVALASAAILRNPKAFPAKA